MIDMFRVQADDKWYVAKVSLHESGDDTIKVGIRSIHEVKIISASSHSVVRQIFTSEDGTTFSQMKFASIFQALMNQIAKKYRVKKIIYLEH